jgi:hypothetical protein
MGLKKLACNYTNCKLSFRVYGGYTGIHLQLDWSVKQLKSGGPTVFCGKKRFCKGSGSQSLLHMCIPLPCWFHIVNVEVSHS